MEEDREKQRDIIKKLMSTTELTVDKPAYLISGKWFLTFKDIISFDEGDPTDEEIPPIDNESLLNNGKLKNDLQENIDFVIVTSEVWQKLKEFYGGGPDVTAKVVYNPMKKQNVVVVRKMSLIIFYKDQQHPFITTQYETVSDLKQKAIE